MSLPLTAGLADTILKNATKELGSTGTKWSISAAVAHYGRQAELRQILAQARVNFARMHWFGPRFPNHG